MGKESVFRYDRWRWHVEEIIHANFDGVIAIVRVGVPERCREARISEVRSNIVEFQAQYANSVQSPEEALLAALRTAPEEGWEIGELISLTGMTRTTLYRYMRDLVTDGRAYQVSRGRWRARPTEGGHDE